MTCLWPPKDHQKLEATQILVKWMNKLYIRTMEHNSAVKRKSTITTYSDMDKFQSYAEKKSDIKSVSCDTIIYIEQVLLYSTRNCIQYSVINHNGREY